MIKLKIKTGDIVRVIAGDHKGSEGKVLLLFMVSTPDVSGAPHGDVIALALQQMKMFS